MAFVSQQEASPEWSHWGQDREPCGWMQNAPMRLPQWSLPTSATKPSYCNTSHLASTLAAPQPSDHSLMPYYHQPAPASTATTQGAILMRHPYANAFGDVRGAPPKTEPDTVSFSFNNVKSASQDTHSSALQCPVTVSLTVPSKTICRNETINPSDRIEFSTAVDDLMRIVQSKGEQQRIHEQLPSPELLPASTARAVMPSLSVTAQAQPQPKKASSKARQFVCDGPGCNRAFVQKTHYEIHRRTHTGERPYKCSFPGCGHTTTQSGNLKNHERRHTGERPYKCSYCTKTFPHKGNAKTHERTHESNKPLYICILDNCTKTFATLGNMKSHQNTYHMPTLLELTEKFVKFSTDGHIPEEYRELYSYFTTLYKNTNKGIRGRGKNRKIAGSPRGPRRATMAPSPPSSICEPQTPISDRDHTVSDVKYSLQNMGAYSAGVMTPHHGFATAGRLSPGYPPLKTPESCLDESRRSSSYYYV